MKKLTIALIKSQYPNTILLSTEYDNSTSDLNWLCSCGIEFTRSYERMKYNKYKTCDTCADHNHRTNIIQTMSHTHDYVSSFISKQGCSLLSQYTGDYTELLTIVCKCGHQFDRSFQTFKNSKCFYCENCSNKKQWNTEKVRSLAIERNTKLLNLYNPNQQCVFECSDCKVPFSVMLQDFIKKANALCPTCSRKKAWKENINKIKITEVREYVNSFGCTLLSPVFDTITSILDIQCRCGKCYQQSYAVFRSRRNKECPTCAKIRTHGWTDIQNDQLNDKTLLHDMHHVKNLNMHEIANQLGVSLQTVCNYFHNHNIPILHLAKSSYETTITNHLHNLLPDVTILTHVRNIISPFELDLYFPDFKLAVEINGLYWHSEKIINDKKYHIRKHEMCIDKGITLLSLYEDEIVEKYDIIINMIIHKLGRAAKEKLYARQTKVHPVDLETRKRFFEKYHIQGNSRSSVSYGLFFQDRIVACIIFIEDQPGKFCLNRFATSSHVVGGFSKLLRWFMVNHRWTTIETFADRRISHGRLYQKTGFVFDRLIKPDYYYTKNGKRYHKFNFRHSSLKKKLKMYDSTQSEHINCMRNQYYRIWDCGKIKYVIHNKT